MLQILQHFVGAVTICLPCRGSVSAADGGVITSLPLWGRWRAEGVTDEDKRMRQIAAPTTTIDRSRRGDSRNACKKPPFGRVSEAQSAALTARRAARRQLVFAQQKTEGEKSVPSPPVKDFWLRDCHYANNPSEQNQRFCPPPFAQGRLSAAAGLRPPLRRADFPVSGENVREADKRGAGPAGLAFAKQKTGGENIPQFVSFFLFLSVCGARQPLRLTKQACVLPTAAHTALALDSATGGGQARGPPSKIKDFCHLPHQREAYRCGGGFGGS